jgi:hypothetical protein
MEQRLRSTSAREVKIVDARRAHERKTFLREEKLLLTKFLANEEFCENDVAIYFRISTTT